MDYIELIRGTSGELDVRGSTQIVNVVLYEQLSNTSLAFEANMDYYQDTEAKYQRRPSLWIEPVNDWGKGQVMLAEIPADEKLYEKK